MSPRIGLVFLVLVAAGCRSSTSRAGSDPPPGAGEVTIVRDHFGVPHVYGPTDASVVFGLAYAQAEDEVWQIEDNFLSGLGRASEVWGEETWVDDVLTRGLEIPRLAREEYERSTPRMRALYDAYAAGLNHYLDEHREVELVRLERFEPWHTLAFLRYKYFVQEFVGYAGVARDEVDPEAWKVTGKPGGGKSSQRTLPDAWREPEFGSNTWAITPAKSANGHAMLFMNPHVSFFGVGLYYESHLVSGEGWNLSGTGRYGFPFPYIAHNSFLGWSHTDNYPDHGDLYTEVFDKPDEPLAYRYGDGYRQATEWDAAIDVRTSKGMARRRIIFRKTHHGPLLLARDGRPLAIKLANLAGGGWYDQHYAMGRARTLDEFRTALERNAINYMNVMYADIEGNAYYVYNGIVPRRRPEVDWRFPVDGSNPENEWQGFHDFEELPQILNPECGFLLSTNSTPFTASATDVPDPRGFPPYMIGPETNNPRARVSRQILTETEKFDLESWSRAALDTRVFLAREWVADLEREWNELPEDSPYRRLQPQVDELMRWDCIADVESMAMTLLVLSIEEIESGRAKTRVEGLAAASRELERSWGTALVPWGEINRMQRRHWSLEEPFDDDMLSVGVPGGPGRLGMAFVYHARAFPGMKRRYGTHGNSYVSVVEFGPRVEARSILFFGQSGDPDSPHYFDQAALYGQARFKPAWFQREDVMANAERIYRPLK
jgi:acyl-homoserine-lactone acylase